MLAERKHGEFFMEGRWNRPLVCREQERVREWMSSICGCASGSGFGCRIGSNCGHVSGCSCRPGVSTGLDAGDWGRGGVCSCGAGVGMGTVAATGVGIEADTRVGHIFYSQKRLFLYFLPLLLLSCSLVWEQAWRMNQYGRITGHERQH